MRKTPSAVATQAKRARQVERALRAEADPWFGKRRRAGEMGRNKTRAAASRNACRGKVWA